MTIDHTARNLLFENWSIQSDKQANTASGMGNDIIKESNPAKTFLTKKNKTKKQANKLL